MEKTLGIARKNNQLLANGLKISTFGKVASYFILFGEQLMLMVQFE